MLEPMPCKTCGLHHRNRDFVPMCLDSLKAELSQAKRNLDGQEALAEGLRILYKFTNEKIPDEFYPENEIARLVEIIRKSEPARWGCNDCGTEWLAWPTECPGCESQNTDPVGA